MASKDFELDEGFTEDNRVCIPGWCDKITTVCFCSVLKRKIGNDELVKFPQGCPYGEEKSIKN